MENKFDEMALLQNEDSFLMLRHQSGRWLNVNEPGYSGGGDAWNNGIGVTGVLAMTAAQTPGDMRIAKDDTSVGARLQF